MNRIITRFWQLPDPTIRKFGSILLMPKSFSQSLNPKRDIDYLCYQAGVITQLIGFIVLFILLADVLGRFGFFIDTEYFSSYKVVFFITWMKFMSIAAPTIGIFFYVRLRLPIDIKNEKIPFMADKKFMRQRNKKEWIITSLFLFIIFFSGMLMSDSYSQGFIEMYGLENSLVALFIQQALFLLFIPFCVSFCISQALIIEKIWRFFPEALRDFEE